MWGMEILFYLSGVVWRRLGLPDGSLCWGLEGPSVSTDCGSYDFFSCATDQVSGVLSAVQSRFRS